MPKNLSQTTFGFLYFLALPTIEFLQIIFRIVIKTSIHSANITISCSIDVLVTILKMIYRNFIVGRAKKYKKLNVV